GPCNSSMEPLERRQLLSGATQLLANIDPSTAGVLEAADTYWQSVVSNGVYYFRGTTVATGQEVWRSDGTPAGTYLLKDIYHDANTASPDNLSDVNGTLFFTATDPSGREIYKSDGTTGGTVAVAPVPQLVEHTYNFFAAGGLAYFSAYDDNLGQELWRSDGTA